MKKQATNQITPKLKHFKKIPCKSKKGNKLTSEMRILPKGFTPNGITDAKDLAKTQIKDRLQCYLAPINIAVQAPQTDAWGYSFPDTPTAAPIKVISAKPKIKPESIKFVEKTDTDGVITIRGSITVPQTASVIHTNCFWDASRWLTMPTGGRAHVDWVDSTVVASHITPEVYFTSEGNYTITWVQDDRTGYWSSTATDLCRMFDPKVLLKDEIKRTIASNLLIKIGKKNTARNLLETSKNVAEIRARDTLREMLTESEWRRYVTNGFIMVKGNSGRWYQIFNKDSERIRVYQDNKHIENICIHSDRECPPTDHVINMKVLIELDEDTVIRGGNISKVSNSSTFKLMPATPTPLIDIFKKTKISSSPDIYCPHTLSA